MVKQLELFPELAKKLVSTLDEKAFDYGQEYFTPEVDAYDLQMAYKNGALEVLTELIDLLRKYTDLHES